MSWSDWIVICPSIYIALLNVSFLFKTDVLKVESMENATYMNLTDNTIYAQWLIEQVPVEFTSRKCEPQSAHYNFTNYSWDPQFQWTKPLMGALDWHFPHIGSLSKLSGIIYHDLYLISTSRNLGMFGELWCYMGIYRRAGQKTFKYL